MEYSKFLNNSFVSQKKDHCHNITIVLISSYDITYSIFKIINNQFSIILCVNKNQQPYIGDQYFPGSYNFP